MEQSQESPSRSRGRPFRKGNSGRRRGSRNRSSVIAAALVRGDAAALAQKAKEIGLAGNVPMLIFLLGRLLPRERLIMFDLKPINFASDAVEVLGDIMRGISQGKITPKEGASLAEVVNWTVRAIEIVDVVKRVDALEKRLQADTLDEMIRRESQSREA
jgi:hypothetical protein